MSILDFKGRQAGPGLPVLYHLNSGQIFFSEEVKEDGDSFVFDADRTCLIAIQPAKGNGQVTMNMMKLSEQGFKAKQVRVLKTAIVVITDCGEQAVVDKCHEAMSGLTIAPPNAIH